MLALVRSFLGRPQSNVQQSQPEEVGPLGPPNWIISDQPSLFMVGKQIKIGIDETGYSAPWGKLAYLIFTYDADTMKKHPEAGQVLQEGAWNTCNALGLSGFPTIGYGVGPLYKGESSLRDEDYVGQYSYVKFPAKNLDRVRSALTSAKKLLPKPNDCIVELFQLGASNTG